MNPIGEIISEFRCKRDHIEMSRDEMVSYLEPYGENVLLYGAGSSGIAFLYDLKKLGIQPRYFVDANKAKAGSVLEGVEIIIPDDIKDRVAGEYIIIVCINTDGRRYCKSFDEALRTGGHHGVYDKLYDAGCKNVIDYTFFRRCFSIFNNEKYNAPSCSDVDMMIEHEDEVVKAYDILEDGMSRKTYEEIVRFRLIDDSIKVPTLPQDSQYFEKEFYHPREDAIFVDCGAFNGISAKTFLKIQRNEFEHYYGFEPDRDNYVKLEEYLCSLPERMRNRMSVFEQAIWKEEANIQLYRLCGPGSFIAQDIGTDSVRAIPIDKIINITDRVTYIKMNIEGSEKQALTGAEQTIKVHKPELAVAGYHRTEDLWEIPLTIKKYRCDYRINLRSYMNHISFVYYAS